MIVTIMQPAYLPWLGFFDRVHQSDIFVILDDVQLDTNSKTSFTTRNKVRTKEGWIWLSVPVQRKGNYGALFINELQVVNDKWPVKHWKSILANYGKTPFFKDHKDFFENFYTEPHSGLYETLEAGMLYLIEAFGIKKEVVRSSSLSVEGTKDNLILNICKHLGATTYISGPFGRTYLDHNAFEDEKIQLQFHDYDHPEYSQYFTGFEPYMSSIDLLFNHGPAGLETLVRR